MILHRTLNFFSPGLRRYAVFAAKLPIEMRIVAKSAGVGHVLNGIRGDLEQIHGTRQSQIADIVKGRHTVFFFEQIDDVVFTEIEVIARLFKGYCL